MLLAKTSQGNLTAMRQRIKLHSQNYMIATTDLHIALTIDGHLIDLEAKKVCNFFDVKGKVQVQKFEDYLSQSLNEIGN